MSWHGILLSETARLAPFGSAGAVTGGVLSSGQIGAFLGPSAFSLLLARWSEIRDSCFQRLMAVMESAPFGVSQALWQPMARIFQQDGQSQHALLMALARGELTYGQFVQDSTRITARMYAAVEPFIREAGVLGQVAMA